MSVLLVCHILSAFHGHTESPPLTCGIPEGMAAKENSFFRFSSSKEEKKPFRTWIRVPGSYGQQFVIPQNDDDEVAGTADMGFEEDAGEEEVIGVEDSAADQEVEVGEEPTAELDGQMQEAPAWEVRRRWRRSRMRRCTTLRIGRWMVQQLMMKVKEMKR